MKSHMKLMLAHFYQSLGVRYNTSPRIRMIRAEGYFPEVASLLYPQPPEAAPSWTHSNLTP